VKQTTAYMGQDENGDPIYNPHAKLPVITFRGTIKLHGTNAAVAYNSIDGMWAQSRENIITPTKDNAGFAFYVESHKEVFQKLIDTIKERENINTETHIITIFGEWCGKGIQSGVSISSIDKMFMIFNVKIAPVEKNLDDLEDTEASRWVSHFDLDSPEDRIFNIENHEHFELEVDFSRPDIAQAKMIELVQQVEQECPVGKAFGVTKTENTCTIGEGIVWKGWYKGNQYIFKTKGEKHSTSKVKTMVPIDVEKMNSIHEFVDYAVTENRLNQGIEQVFTTTSTTPEMKKMGDFIRWVVGDVTKEEVDTMAQNGLEPKDVNKHISIKVRNWFSAYLDKQAGIG